MGLVVYNTLGRRKEPFIPREDGKVFIYSCGITPYDATHLGHARQYVIWDVFRKYLKKRGYEVTYIQNFTDVDDKIIAKANAKGTNFSDISERYIGEYYEVMDALGVQRADAYPKVSQHIDEVISMVGDLIRRGFAYAVDGNVYYDVSKFTEYGKLSGRSMEDMEAGARVEVDERKDDPMDFAVWKAAKPGEPAWDSPWGKGRPGWHIECSAMALKYLGAGFDFHGGGMDLIFPHHENEIAQAEGATGKPFARYWLHHGFINVNAEKMSKSLGNFKSVKDLLNKYDPQTVRLFLISLQYRSPISFSDDEIVMAKKSKERLFNAFRTMKDLAGREGGEECADADLKPVAAQAEAKFEAAMDDDFNTALALAGIYDFVREINKAAAIPQVKGGAAVPSAKYALGVFTELLSILGLDPEAEPEAASDDAAGQDAAAVEGLMQLLIEVRKDIRAAKNWALSDKIRDGLKELGILLEDTPQGTRWRKNND